MPHSSLRPSAETARSQASGPSASAREPASSSRPLASRAIAL
jgi:hypothetical protein